MRLTKAESAAYANGERRFWRACNKSINDLPYLTQLEQRQLRVFCPYGKPGDRIELVERGCPGAVQAAITAITVENRSGKWGWVVEVKA